MEMLQGQGHAVDHLALSSDDPDAIHAAAKWAERLGHVDLLHIDGDHTMKACLADWENYHSLVRPGGFVVFHDTRNPDEPGVRHVFEAVQVKGMTDHAWEVRSMDGSPKGRGIGVVRLPQLDILRP
jgi:cephalosporin hydroxylase